MKNVFAALALLGVFFLNGCCTSSVPLGQPMEKAERPFRFEQDRFTFANETVWSYEDGKHASKPSTQGAKPGKKYTRRCFVMTRAALQFWKFARFESRGKPLGPQELADRIRAVTTIDVWRPSLSKKERVVFPGYANLHALSKAEPRVLQKNIGLGWPTYFRPGNMPIVFPPGKGHQERMHLFLQEHLKAGQPAVAWLVNFPSLSINHTVLVFGCLKKGDAWIYEVYDPNLPIQPLPLTYDPKTRVFSYARTFYFKGGPVRVRPVYLSPFQ